ncbi:MAG: WS/DGAT domain-containing protein [Myxococcota bacterium]
MGDADLLSAVDNAWLRMDRPDNPMVITGVMEFASPPDEERLLELLRVRLRWFPRFSQRIVPGTERRAARWERDPSFDVAHHVAYERLSFAEGQLHAEIGKIVSRPLSLERPLWRLTLLVDEATGRTFLVARLHHCIADGFALMYVTLGLTDETPDAGLERPYARAEALGGGLGKLLAGLEGAVRDTWRRFRERPSRVLLRGRQVVADLGRLAFLSGQPATELRSPLTDVKVVAWSDAIDLGRIKRIGQRLGGTINDTLMAACAGALRRYLLERGERGFDLRAAVPVNLRRSSRELRQLGNRFGLVFLELPLHVAGPGERFRLVKARMDRLKRSPEALVVWGIMQAIGVLPLWAEAAVVAVLGSKSTAVVTNVPGPRERRFLAGRAIERILFWVPQSGSVGLGLSIFSSATQRTSADRPTVTLPA